MNTKHNKLDKIFEKFSEEKGFENKLLRYKMLEVLSYCRGPVVLDVGCGVGFLTKALGQKFDKVVGIDGSSRKIKIAKRKNKLPNVDYKCILFENYKPTQKFDTVIMTNVLEHFEKPIAFLKTVSQWIKPRGRIIITVPNALALHKRLGKEMGLIEDYYKLTSTDKQKGHFKNYDKKLLKKDLSKAGFSSIKVSGFFLKPFSSTQMEIFSDEVLDGLYKLGKSYPNLCSSLITVGEK